MIALNRQRVILDDFGVFFSAVCKSGQQTAI
jgi:hypothetical protein